MAFQKTVQTEQGFGVPGDIHLNSPTRAESLLIQSGSGQKNIYGYCFTKDASTNIAKVGGEISSGRVFAGILANPKESISYGTEAGTLEPTLNIPDNQHGDFITMGDVVVKVSTKCAVGDLVVYDTTTGELSTVAAGTATAGAGKAFVPNAVIYRYPVTAAGGLTVIRLTN
ncbi:hypothetical protein EV694_1704 [Volucribacter psittacicida]|uniref:Uncharacterized protein n=1 Tax=Volucribacter psittacicida TaxID=203482 RepID=A0A4R1FRG3_9PAST|nr:hypothetical protein [Volucribacter psittacicida]TCJ96152.1 hypothetical protein EV694_1704 [Volucribacter psittacicida]